MEIDTRRIMKSTTFNNLPTFWKVLVVIGILTVFIILIVVIFVAFYLYFNKEVKTTEFDDFINDFKDGIETNKTIKKEEDIIYTILPKIKDLKGESLNENLLIIKVT